MPNDDFDMVYLLMEQEVKEEYNDPDYQQYITMRAPKEKWRG